MTGKRGSLSVISLHLLVCLSMLFALLGSAAIPAPVQAAAPPLPDASDAAASRPVDSARAVGPGVPAPMSFTASTPITPADLILAAEDDAEPNPWQGPELVSEVPSLSLKAGVEYAERGIPFKVVLDLAAPDSAALADAAVSVRLPNGLRFVSADSDSVTADPADGTVRWSAGTLSGREAARLQLVLLATDEAPNVVKLVAEVATDGGIPETATAEIGVATQGAVGRDGGTLSTPDGKIRVEFPAGSVESDVDVTLVPMTLPVSRMAYSFQLLANSAHDGSAVTRFAKPLTIRASYTAEDEATMRRNATMPFLPDVWWLNEKTGLWEALQGQADLEARVVTAQVDHFTGFSVGGNGNMEPGPVPSMAAGQVDLVTGALTYGYSFELPQAKGGLVPSLGVSYSGVTADDHMVADQLYFGNYGNAPAQPGDVGEGWTLSVPMISRDTLGAPFTDTIHRYYVSMAGGSYQLVYSGTNGLDDTYVTKEDQFWKIVWTHDSAQNYERGTWNVWTKDGVKYTFDQRANFIIWEGDCQTEQNCTPHAKTYRWYLSGIEDTNGNTASYSYSADTRTVGPTGWPSRQMPYTYTTHLTQISYGGVYSVELSYDSSRSDYSGNWATDYYSQKYYSTKRLAYVKVWANGSQVRRYVFTHNGDTAWAANDPVWLRPTAIQVHGADDAQTLPETSFVYYLGDKGPEWLLSQVNNGNGGKLTVNAFGWAFAGYQITVGEDQLNVHRWRVTSNQLEDGLGNTYRHAFSYGDMVGNSTWQYEEFLGNLSVTETVYQQNSTTAAEAKTTHYYHQKSGTDTDPRRGREYETVWKTGNDATLRTASQVWTANGLSSPTRSFVSLDRTVVTDTGASGVTTRYYYTETLQGAAQYGNITAMEEWGAGGSAYRTTTHQYYPNTSAWIVGKVAETKVYTGSAGGSLAAWTQYIYDGAGSVTTPPTDGNLTSEKHSVDLSSTWLTTSYHYDAYGNMDQITDPESNQTVATYDATYHAYITAVDPPMIDATTYAYDYVLGKITSVTGPNGANTAVSYEWDTFGRIKKVIRPGDSTIYPTLAYTYTDYGSASSPFRIQTFQQVATGSGTYYPTIQFYDGLGQLIQTNVGRSDNTGDMYVTNSAYGALGIVDAYLPYTTTFSSSYRTPDTGKPKTSTLVDALGRTTIITNTDGTTVTTTYSGFVTSVLDENHHQTAQERDAYGRVVTVREYTGTIPSPTLYATTTYAYNVLDALSSVTDQSSNQTTIAYDPLGRKVAMNDPDMGAWSYTYDSNGNLKTQTDALGTVLWFNYDDLNRMTEKRLTNSGGTLLAQYYYDQANRGYSQGHRTRMEAYVGGALDNYATWDYNTRELVSREDRVIVSGGDTYTTQWTYDPRDQVVTQTYPDAEAVVTAYDQWGRPTTLVGASSYAYVAGTDYNERGQIDQLKLGGAIGSPTLQTDYQYYTVAGAFRLQYLQTGPNGQFDGIQKLQYTYDNVGNVSTIIDHKQVDAPQTQTFTYDPLNRLTSAVATGGITQTYGLEGYNYNEIGNITSKAGYVYTYDTTHKHAVRTVNGTGGSGQTITIRAKGVQYSGVWPSMTLKVNGSTIQTWSVSQTSYTDYTQNNVTLSGNDVIEVVYTNDSGTRDLFVDYVTVAGSTVQAEGGAMVYDRGASTAAFDGLDVIAGQEQMAWNGALRFVRGANAYAAGYDANGNMTSRVVQAKAFLLTYDSENRLSTVAGSATESYVYDGDGNRVKATVAGVATVYVGQYYEKKVVAGTITKYYYLSGKRVAVMAGAVLHLLLTDHLGSSNVTYNTSTSAATTQRYYPWGTIRPGPDNALPTDYTFTGQKLDSATGLMYYGARWYDPALGRFVQADTIVPRPGDPQSLSRYSYVLNNPLRYIDPTGHFTEQELLDWGVFYGPNQLAGTRDGSDYYAEWYYMLRAAELGDTVSFEVGSSMRIEGRFELSNGGLSLVTGNGASYGVSFDTLMRGDTFVGRLPGLSLTKADGTRLRGAEELRRFVQSRDYGYHDAGDFDYYSASVGFFAGVGGLLTIRWDRYGRVYMGVSLGIGVGNLAVSVQGGYIPQDYVPDRSQVETAVSGWGMSLQGGYGWGGGGVSVVDSGPVPYEVGFTTVGIAGTIGYSWEVR